MKNYREMADSVFERSRVIIERKIKKRKLLQRISAAASCCCLVALLCFGAWRSGAFDGSPQLISPDAGSGSDKDDSAPEANEPAGPSDNAEQEPDNPPQNNQPSDNGAEGDGDADGPQGAEQQDPPDEAGEESPGGGTQTDPSGGGAPQAVYSTVRVSHEEAERLFGLPVAECSEADFLGYELGVVSSDGDIHADGVIYLSVIYLFTDGEITLTGMDRVVGEQIFDNQWYRSEEYGGFTFWIDRNNIIWLQLQDCTMSAVFDDKQSSEIYDLMLSLI